MCWSNWAEAHTPFCQPCGGGRHSLPEGGCYNSSGTCWQDGWGLRCTDVPLPRNTGVCPARSFPVTAAQHSVGWEYRGALVLNVLWHELFSYKSAVVCFWSYWDTKVHNVQFVYLSVWMQLRNSNRCSRHSIPVIVVPKPPVAKAVRWAGTRAALGGLHFFA